MVYFGNVNTYEGETGLEKLIFVINSGSSSLKFQLMNLPQEEVICKGIFERIGGESMDFTMNFKEKNTEVVNLSTHKEAVEYLLDKIIELGVIDSLDDIEGVGHRVAHGGSTPKSQIVDDKVIKLIDDLSVFAPSHNPVNLIGILAFKDILPNIPQVAVYDTAFHQTIQPEYYLYPLPYKYFEENKIRKYGFHGTSHKFIVDTLKDSNPELKKIVNCHLGNGASICAINDGKSINTSMGFTPLAGLMMGTRTGDIDPAIVTYLMHLENTTADEIDDILYKESGFLGVSGISNDARDVEKAANEGHERAKIAMKMFVNRVAQTIASYAVDLDGLDAVIFTAGIGENSNTIRKLVCKQLSLLGIKLDAENNNQNTKWIHADDSKVKVGVIPTNEELMIARDVVALTNN